MRFLLTFLLIPAAAASDVSALYFGAEYCSPCRSLRGSLARLQSAYTVNRVDAGDENERSRCTQYGIATIPQIVFIRDGVEIDRIHGAGADWLPRCEDRLSGRNNWRPIRAAVRIRTPGGIGSGVILSSVPGRTVVATAAHVVRGAARITVDVFRDSGVQQYSATTATSNNTTDTALLLVVSNKLPLPSAVGSDSSVVSQGDTAFGIGCSGGRGVSVMRCRIQSITNGDIFASGVPAQGRSGGGLYNQRFELIGICSAASAERGNGWYIGAEKLKTLLSEWEPTQYRSGFGVGIGVGIGVSCVTTGPCRNPNCRRCYPSRMPASPKQSIQGPPGQTGATGPRGPAGSDATVDLSPLIQRIETLENMKRPVILIDGKSKKIIDREEYGNGQPILLDIRSITND